MSEGKTEFKKYWRVYLSAFGIIEYINTQSVIHLFKLELIYLSKILAILKYRCS